MELNPAFASDASPSHATNGVDEGSEPDAPTKSAHIVLDHSGDVILKIGDASLLVSSKVLSVASSVFRAMFGPHFQEGDALHGRYVLGKGADLRCSSI
jgi:hypothetical protein